MPPLALLAGGLATRLRPITETIPKSMVEVAGEPFIAHQLRQLRKEGIRRVVLCVGHLSQTIRDFVGTGGSFGLEVVYSDEGESRLGTGGALRKALPLLGDEFLVLYGDSYLPIPFSPPVDAFRASGLSALMSVYRNQGRFDRSNVVSDGNRVAFYSKTETRPGMDFIDYGLSVLSAGVLANRPEEEVFDLAEIFAALASAGRLAAFEVSERFFEIGSHDGLVETAAFFANGR